VSNLFIYFNTVFRPVRYVQPALLSHCPTFCNHRAQNYPNHTVATIDNFGKRDSTSTYLNIS
jgi:hypothetical protein